MCMSLNEIAIAIVACLRLADGYLDLQRIGFCIFSYISTLMTQNLWGDAGPKKIIFTGRIQFCSADKYFPSLIGIDNCQTFLWEGPPLCSV